MKASTYLPVLLIAGALSACQQSTKKPLAKDTAHADTVIKIDSITDTLSATDKPGADHVPLAQVIVPGVSLGQTTINESSENVYNRMGKPDGGDAAMGKSMAVWYAKHDTAGFQTQVFFSRDMGNDETARVKQIRVTSPFFKTNDDKKVGSALAALQADFKLKKVASFTEKGGTFNIYDDDKAGIGFETNAKDIVTAVIVHVPGLAAGGTYLPFHPNAKPL